MSARYSKDDLIKIATTHADMGIREAACEAIYQSGRADAANEFRDALTADTSATVQITEPQQVTP